MHEGGCDADVSYSFSTYYILGNDHHIPFHLVNERYIQYLCKNIQIVITDEPVHT